MKRLTIAAAAALALVTASCTTPKGALDPRALDPSLPLVLERYGAWVEAGTKPDGTPLEGIEQETWAATGEELEATYSEALSAAKED